MYSNVYVICRQAHQRVKVNQVLEPQKKKKRTPLKAKDFDPEQNALEEHICDLTEHNYCSEHDCVCYKDNGQCLKLKPGHLKTWARAIVRIIVHSFGFKALH